MKKWIGILAAGLLAVMLVACGGKENGDGAATPSDATTTTVTEPTVIEQNIDFDATTQAETKSTTTTKKAN